MTLLNAKKILVMTGALLVGTSDVYAQATTSATAAPQAQGSLVMSPDAELPGSQLSKKLTVQTGLEYTQKVAEPDQGSRQSTMDFTLSPSYKLSDLLTLTASATVSRDDYAQYETFLSNTQIVLGIKGYVINENWATSHSLIGVLPTNETLRKSDRIQGAVGTSNGLNFANPWVKLTYRLSFSKNFHEFDRNAENRPNMSYTVGNSIGAFVPVYKQFYVSASGLYRLSMTYGDSSRTAFVFNADLNYDINPRMTANVGTTNEGSAVKANGVDSNLAFYDDKSSLMRAGLSYVF